MSKKRKYLFLILVELMASCANGPDDSSKKIDKVGLQANQNAESNNSKQNCSMNIIGADADLPENDVRSLSTVGIATFSGGICSGIVVTKNLILTAGHCLREGKPQFILLGKREDKSSETRVVQNYLVHPNFESEINVIQADIAWIKTTTDLPKRVPPAPLLTSPLKALPIETILVGFGLQGAEDGAEVGEKKNVTTIIDSLITTPQKIGKYTYKNVLRIGDASRGTCKGDSGGPAFIKYNNINYVVGVTSRAADNLECGASYYTYLTPYLQWIETTSKQKLYTEATLGSTSNGQAIACK